MGLAFNRLRRRPFLRLAHDPTLLPARIRKKAFRMMAHLWLTLGLSLGMTTALWLVSLPLKDVSIIDILWAPAFAVLGGAIVWSEGGAGGPGWVAQALVTVWGLRLGSHIFLRHRRLGCEDHRYTTIRRKFGPGFPLLSLAVIFWFQALLLWVISWPLQAAVAARGPVTALTILAWTVIAAGLVIEAIADLQLTAFRSRPGSQGRVLDSGLWRWSRHPNYFGDFLIWWGFYLAGAAAGAPWWILLGPIVISALLLHFSGAGLMEDTITDRRPGYAAYIERTSAFFPWPRRR
jgi:steroid 5-alpha reductase family enzyme